MKYNRIYHLLTKYGHSPMKATEIVIDAIRGDDFAIDWIKVIYSQRHQ